MVKSLQSPAGLRGALSRLPGRQVSLLTALFLLGLGVPAGASWAEAAPPLRVATSGDYVPFSSGAGAAAEGYSLTLVRAFARDHGRPLEIVPFRWPELLTDLAADRFDLAASGVTVRPERSAAGRFSLPVAVTGAVALVPRGSALTQLADLDAAGVLLAVNRGGHLERVTRRHFPAARIQALSPNAAVREALVAGRVDAAISDSVEAPHWRAGTELRQLGPFTRDRKAWLLRADARELATRVDTWLLAREADGSLARWRREHGLTPDPAAAAPLAALLAAIDERLSLMPQVAEAKRARGLPLEVKEREARVLDAAVAGVREAAAATARPPPADERVRAFYRTQIEVAKAVQRATPVTPGMLGGALFDLEGALRPALLRIGEKIARLLVALPDTLDCASLRVEAERALRAPHVRAEDARAIADSLAAVRDATCGR